MLSCTDSFIQYLSTALANNPAVTFVRTSSQTPTSGEFKMDCLNVSILDFMQDGYIERPLISLDIIGSDERQVFGWVKRIRDVLFQVQYTTEYDYSIPSAPVATGSKVGWHARDISFDKVRSTPSSVHVNSTFSLFHARY